MSVGNGEGYGAQVVCTDAHGDGGFLGSFVFQSSQSFFFLDDEYDTIAGLVISQLDRVPEETEHPVVNYKNLRIKVLKVEENAIAKVLIHINPVEDPEEGSKEENPKSDE